MTGEIQPGRLSQAVDPARDHTLGPPEAEITLVEYGSYACPRCRVVHARLADLRQQFGDRLQYVFRHHPVPGNPLAAAAAELVERARTPRQFWKAHVALMTRSAELTEDDLKAVEEEFDLAPVVEGSGPNSAGSDATGPGGNGPGAIGSSGNGSGATGPDITGAAWERVQSDLCSAEASGVLVTPTFFINGRRYDGPWDGASFSDALFGSLGHRVRTAALDFVNWPSSTGILLLLATMLALALSNSGLQASFAAVWSQPVGVSWGDWRFALPLLNWVNDGLLTIFFLVVGLEIKREFTIGHLSSLRLGALPVAAAVGGMVVPALIYILIVPDGSWKNGWGIPIATDTAFAVALIAMMGRRVPVELRIFLTAAAIVDDIAAVAVVAVFYTEGLNPAYLLGAAAVVAVLAAMNHLKVYRLAPYIMVGVVLWVLIHAGGVHATLAGVILALFIPTRPPPNYQALMIQADTLVAAEVQRGEEEMRHSLSNPTLRALDAIHDRLESPAARLLRSVEIRSSYIVLPIFALANAGVTLVPGLLDGKALLVTAIVAGLVIGKPLGLLLASMLAVKLGVAVKPAEYSWLQLAGAGCLAGIGFTMSLFIAGQAFATQADFDAAKLAIFGASILAAAIGGGLLWWAGGRPSPDGQPR